VSAVTLAWPTPVYRWTPEGFGVRCSLGAAPGAGVRRAGRRPCTSPTPNGPADVVRISGRVVGSDRARASGRICSSDSSRRTHCFRRSRGQEDSRGVCRRERAGPVVHRGADACLIAVLTVEPGACRLGPEPPKRDELGGHGRGGAGLADALEQHHARAYCDEEATSSGAGLGPRSTRDRTGWCADCSRPIGTYAAADGRRAIGS
jgi:hypothetical protein